MWNPEFGSVQRVSCVCVYFLAHVCTLYAARLRLAAPAQDGRRHFHDLVNHRPRSAPLPYRLPVSLAHICEPVPQLQPTNKWACAQRTAQQRHTPGLELCQHGYTAQPSPPSLDTCNAGERMNSKSSYAHGQVTSRAGNQSNSCVTVVSSHSLTVHPRNRTSEHGGLYDANTHAHTHAHTRTHTHTNTHTQ